MTRTARELLDTLRVQRRLDMATIGQLLGKSRTTLARYSDGQTEPDHATLLAMESLTRMDAEAFEDLLRQRTQRGGGADLAAFLAEASEMRPRQVARPRGDDPERTISVQDGRREAFAVAELAAQARTLGTASPLARAMTPGTHPELIPGELSTTVAAPTAPNILAALGAQFLGIPDPWPGKLALVAEDPSGAWVDDNDEGAAAEAETESDMQFANHTLERHTLRIGPMTLSRRLRKQSGALAQVVAGLRRAVIRHLSDAALNGTGGMSAQPQGLLSHTAEFRQTTAGEAIVPALLAGVADMEEDAHLMGPQLRVLAAADTKVSLMSMPLSEAPMWQHDAASPTGHTCAGLPAAVSPHMPSGTLVVGDWRWLEIYHAETFDLHATVDAKDRRKLYAFLDTDVRVVYPAAFRIFDGIVS